MSDVSSESSDEQQLGALGRIGNAPPVEEDRGTAMPQATPEPAPEPSEQDHLAMRRNQVDQKLDQAIVKGDVVDQGKAQLAHRMIDRHEARLGEGVEGGGTPVIETPLGNGTTDVPMAADTSRLPMVGERRQDVTKIATPSTGVPELATPEAGLPVGEAIPDLGTPKAMPEFTGRDASRMKQGQLITTKESPELYQEKKQDLDNRIEAARDRAVDEKATPAEKASARTLADELAMRKTELQRPAAHGLLGKLGRGLETAGNIAGNLVAAPEMSLIPGTELYKTRERQGLLGRIGADVGQEKTLAEADAADTKTTDKYKEIPGGAVNPASGRTEPAFFNPADINEPIHFGNVATAPREGAEATPLGAEGVTNANSGFTDRYQILNPNTPLPKQYVLPANATKADFDRVDKQLENVEKAQGTKAQQEATRQMQKDAQQATKDRFEEGRSQKLVNYRVGENGPLVSGTREEAKNEGGTVTGESTPAMQQKARESYTQYSRLQSNAETAMSTLPAWENETNRKAAIDASKNYWEGVHASIGVAGMAISPEHMQLLVNSDAYKKMDVQGQEHMQNMFQLWSDAINLAKLETNSSRAVQAVIEREERIMPSADKTPAQNIKALEDLYSRLYKDSKEHARPSEMQPLKQGLIPYNATHELHDKKDESVIGYTGADGKDHLFQK